MSSSPFDTPIRLVGPLRSPRQLLSESTFEGRTTTHDPAVAAALGLSGAPIEGPTHLAQFDPLAVALWGRSWFERGCISLHFQTMVVEGEEVVARADADGGDLARIAAAKSDGTPVLTGTISVDPTLETELGPRLAAAQSAEPGELFIMDQLWVGMRSRKSRPTSIDFDSPNGDMYRFTLREKLAASTESSPWFETADNPWGRPILGMEAIGLLVQRVPSDVPIRQPSMGLFLDYEVNVVDGPLFVDDQYRVEWEVVALSETRRTESHWIRSTLTDAVSGSRVAEVLMHIGAFKESYAGYPADRLPKATGG